LSQQCVVALQKQPVATQIMMSNTASLRILLADDHDVMRQGTRALIERQPGWEVCGLASTGREAVAQANQLKPDIVVMDMSMPELNGLDAAVLIKKQRPNTEVVMFTAHEEDDLVRDAFEAGLKSVIFKSEAYECLVEAIQSLSRHKAFFSPKIAEILFSKVIERTSSQNAPGQRLSTREREVVQLVAEGKSNKEVAEALGISIRTAETHRAAILRKLKLDSVASLVRYAIRNKLIAA
jgi:DNA-binding NarL/FixJ family response regulator